MLVIAEGGGAGPKLVIELGFEVEVIIWIAFEGVRKGDGSRSS